MRFVELLRPAALLTALLPALVTGCVGDGRTVHTVERSFRIGEVDLLLLDDDAGDLEVIGEEGRTDVTLIARLKTHRASQSGDDAAERAMRVDVRFVEEGTSRIIAALHDAPPGYYVDLVALTPMDVALEIEDGSGDLRVESVAALRLHDDSGDVHIEDIAGDVAINDDSGDIFIDGVGGKLDLDDGSGDILINGVSGTLDLDDGSGDIAVFNVAGDTKIRDDSGDIALHDLAGVVIDDGSGDIAAVHCGKVKVRSDGSGDVAIVD